MANCVRVFAWKRIPSRSRITMCLSVPPVISDCDLQQAWCFCVWFNQMKVRLWITAPLRLSDLRTADQCLLFSFKSSLWQHSNRDAVLKGFDFHSYVSLNEVLLVIKHIWIHFQWDIYARFYSCWHVWHNKFSYSVKVCSADLFYLFILL